MTSEKVLKSKRRYLFAPLFLTVFATACTNTSAPLSGLFAKKAPVAPTATALQRESARKNLPFSWRAKSRVYATEKQLQPKSRQGKTIDDVNVARLRPAADSTRVALLSPTPVVAPSRFEDVTQSAKGLDASEAVASIPRINPVGKAFGPLGRFHAKLAALRSGKRKEPVTILHIGDSHVASDSFSRGIRTALQSRYGDAGRGMVIPAAAYKYGVADQIKFSTSGRWRGSTALKKGAVSSVFRASVFHHEPLNRQWVLKSNTGSFDWAEVTVATGPSQGAFSMKIGTASKRFDAYSKSKGSKNFRLETRGTRLTVNPGGGAQTTVLNWATGKNRPGVRYVNFGLIGATLDITKLFDKKLVANEYGGLTLISSSMVTEPMKASMTG